ncbi:HSP90-domain-containing protein [Macrolepiota fuliginosa MF-IS2]|uniref:HSP90-domain-containing protein n=1 Tax=Macrolepiota fuliginosa MF-IS2 TaxID=1400762 RepID=A0A9P5XJU7_9AGAR|nr:HSP90-domain-containing protein [Macrolepiota fuliginosa MF-IS2]
MSIPSFVPPLPPAWTEHLAPGGQAYYYNAQTQESTYIRPMLSFQAMATPQMPDPKRKEKALLKKLIPGTDWLRVITNLGNVFYFNKPRKESVWTVPDEMVEAVTAMEQQEKEEEFQAQQELLASDAQAEEAKQMEVDRIKKEMKGIIKRKADEETPLDEFVIAKKIKVEVEGEDEEDSEEDEEEEWQREAAAQLAAEAEEERKRQEEEERKERERQAEARAEAQRVQTAGLINMPEKVNLSAEEGKALFKTLLREKDINPLHPWDTSLPQFVNDPRYVLLPSVAARREAFDEYCRDRLRELRGSAVKKEKQSSDPKREFELLLEKEVKSTRTSWTDFRRSWKKDRRFYGWGRDDREREKRFRDFLKDLGEKKRAATQKAEADFFVLLKEHRGEIREDAVWKEVKKNLTHDPRYDAVGSSSLREELFNTFLKGNVQVSPSVGIEQAPSTAAVLSKQEKKERAVREREERVKAEMNRLEMNIERSRMGINKEEGERDYKSMLVDAIRDPQMTWDDALPQLKTDPRFRNSPLPPNQQLQLFHSHIAHLREKHITNLHGLFQSHSPTLATPFTHLPLESLLGSRPATKLGFDIYQTEHEYDKWQRERTTVSRKAFDEMLAENSFVEFWGRLGKIGGEGVDGGVKADDLGEDEGEGGGGKVDMKALAKKVDLEEMEKVLRSDRRYTMFDHVPEQRETWLRAVMKLLQPFLVTLSILCARVLAGEDVPRAKHDYQSDVARMRNIVINSLYSHREIFLRELVSNANDAIEKLRIISLTDKGVWNGADPLNITIKAEKSEDGKTGKLIISDTGVGMSEQELSTNLGTLAKSGTSEFLARAEGQEGGAQGNLIGAFGLGFYSSFLVADRVEVASVPPPTEKNPNPKQYVFGSAAADSTFEIYPDPRGNTLGRGTEITLHLKEDALEYLEEQSVKDLINKHSSYSSSFPIYLFTQKEREVPDEDAKPEVEAKDEEEKPPKSEETESDGDDDEAIVEEVSEDEEKKEPPAPKTKKIIVDEWEQLNAQPPVWTRDPKTVSDEEYKAFYKSFFKDYEEPLAWQHFSGDSGSGVSFKAIVYLPSKLDEQYWQQPLEHKGGDVKLMVKRVFITSDLGDSSLPKWASWVKVVVDADDLPLNVSRETLQSNRFLRQLKGIILKRLLQLLAKIEEEEPEKFEKVQNVYGSILKLGAVEDTKNREKLTALTRFATNQRNVTSLDQYLENKKKGQKQIFYLAEIGKEAHQLAESVFIERLDARGYEVLLLTEPLDEIMVGNIRQWKNVQFQDVAKAGLKFGDEDQDPEEEKAEQKKLTEEYKPLLDWLKVEAKDVVQDVVLTNRLVKSACAIVAAPGGYTANVQKMMTASNSQAKRGGIIHEYALKAKLLELNPRSPLIEGLLRRIKDLPTEEDEKDLEAEEELKEVASILIDGALVRSGFEVPNSNGFLFKIDRVLRRSLGVSETAPTDETVKPAPPVDPSLPTEEELMEEAWKAFDEQDDGKAKVVMPDHLKDDLSIEMEEIDDDDNPVPQDDAPRHDEL